MPPINQQRSSTGLIVALVVFVILFVTSTIMAMSYYNKLKVANNDMVQIQANTERYFGSEAVLKSPNVQAVQSDKDAGKYGLSKNDSLVEAAIKERNTEGAVVIGTIGRETPGDVTDAAKNALKDAADKLSKHGISVPVDQTPPNLTRTIGTLTTALIEAKDTATADDAKVADRDKQLADVAAVQQQAITTLGTQRTQSDAQFAGKLEVANTQSKQRDDAIAKAAQDVLVAQNATKDAIDKSNAEASDLRRQIAGLQSDNLNLRDRLGRRRIDPSQNIVAHVDGKIVRSSDKDVCYINIGSEVGGISPGLTFEVYDKTAGVPQIPVNATGNEHLPVGKASIEVTAVHQTESECRIIRLQPGIALAEGDPIANLVYDPNVKFKFYVYGNFSMSPSGRPTPADTEVIKRLITQWGGEVVDKIDVDTDFVVLGAEPVIPAYTKDELESPINKQNQDDKTKAAQEYDARRDEAKELHIPIMNQNRFLYYVGYYDQATR